MNSMVGGQDTRVRFKGEETENMSARKRGQHNSDHGGRTRKEQGHREKGLKSKREGEPGEG